MKLVLASNSPRRKELLAMGGYEFSVTPAVIDETPLPGEMPRDYVLRMAEEKARAAAEKALPGSVVLGADTTVIDPTPYGEQIMGKPADEAEAIDMLRQLRGHTHQVYTAVAALVVSSGEIVSETCITDVLMRSYTDEEMLAYVASGDPLDKAGAYAIQSSAFHPVENLQGCYANVVGLPLCYVARLLHQVGITTPVDIGEKCSAAFEFPCSLARQVLEEDTE